MKRDNKIVVDLSKCQHARFGYRNQYGQWRDGEPRYSVRGDPFDLCDVALLADKVMAESFKKTSKKMLPIAVAKHLLDHWTPVVILKLIANESLEYSGKRAVNIYKKWCGRIFNKHKKKG